eukprot:SAG25_NODE_10229_length_342_cov_0.534979_1_plen_65_part_01
MHGLPACHRSHSHLPVNTQRPNIMSASRYFAAECAAARQAACTQHDRVPWVFEISSQPHIMAYFA